MLGGEWNYAARLWFISKIVLSLLGYQKNSEFASIGVGGSFVQSVAQSLRTFRGIHSESHEDTSSLTFLIID